MIDSLLHRNGEPLAASTGVAPAGAQGRYRWRRATTVPDLATLLPDRRPELLIQPFGDAGQYVVKTHNRASSSNSARRSTFC